MLNVEPMKFANRLEFANKFGAQREIKDHQQWLQSIWPERLEGPNCTSCIRRTLENRVWGGVSGALFCTCWVWDNYETSKWRCWESSWISKPGDSVNRSGLKIQGWWLSTGRCMSSPRNGWTQRGGGRQGPSPGTQRHKEAGVEGERVEGELGRNLGVWEFLKAKQRKCF